MNMNKFQKYKIKYERALSNTRAFLYSNPSYSHQTKELDDKLENNSNRSSIILDQETPNMIFNTPIKTLV